MLIKKVNSETLLYLANPNALPKDNITQERRCQELIVRTALISLIWWAMSRFVWELILMCLWVCR